MSCLNICFNSAKSSFWNINFKPFKCVYQVINTEQYLRSKKLISIVCELYC